MAPMVEPAEILPPRQPSPLRVAVFAAMFAVTVAGLVLISRAPQSPTAKRLDSYYYAFMGDFLTRVMLGVESQERETSTPRAAYSADAIAELAAQNYELALERRQDDLGLYVALATIYWHEGLRADAAATVAARPAPADSVKELEFRAGRFKTKAMTTLQRGLSRYSGNRTLSTLVLGFYPYTMIKPAQVEDPALQRIAARIAPGHLLRYLLYTHAGMLQRGRAELQRAYAIGWRTVLRVSFTVVGVLIGMLAGVAIWLLVLLGRLGRPALPVRLARLPWSVWRAAELFILWLFLSLVFEFAAAQFVPPSEIATLPWVFSLAAAYAAAAVAAIAWFVRSAQPESISLRDLGWRRIGPATALCAGIAGYLASLPAVYPVLALVNHFIGSPAPSSPVVPIMMSASGTAPRLVLIVLVVAAAPLAEESIFRGVLFAGLRRRMRFGGAALISALVFAGAHGQLVALAPIAILGIVLAYVYERTGSLWASAITHACFNAASVLALYLLMS